MHDTSGLSSQCLPFSHDCRTTTNPLYIAQVVLNGSVTHLAATQYVLLQYVQSEFYQHLCSTYRGLVVGWLSQLNGRTPAAQARGVLGSTPGNCRPFLYFRLIKSKLIYFQCEAKSSEHSFGTVNQHLVFTTHELGLSFDLLFTIVTLCMFVKRICEGGDKFPSQQICNAYCSLKSGQFYIYQWQVHMNQNV